jgi:transcriptional regulator with XRE-family HTH domain
MATFGERVRQLRVDRRMSQRSLAIRVSVDYTYLSKIENGKMGPPSDRVIHRLAVELGADEEELLALAAKVSQGELRESVARDARVGVLFRRLQSGNLTEEQIRRMIKIMEEGPRYGETGQHE